MSRPLPIPCDQTCGCCEGLEPKTPLVIDNRRSLSAIAYRIGEYAQFRESMLAGLSAEAYSALANLQTRDADDFSLALIDAVACAADVLTFYQERIANESYLGTATERVSLQEMARLIGYRLRPGVAAETWLAFALEPPKTPPPGLATDPGAFITGIPASLGLRAGLQVKSIPGPGEKPQTFETVESIVARPEWNAARPWVSESRAPRRSDREVFLQGIRHNLKVGDALVFVTPAFFDAPTTNTEWDFRLIDAVELDSANDRTRVAWKRGLESVNPFTAAHVYVLRKRAAVFGNNAPLWRSMTDQFRVDYADPEDPDTFDDWPGFTTSALDPTPTGGYFDLDAVYGETTPASLAVLARGEVNRPDGTFPPGTRVAVYRIDSTSELSRAEFAISAKITRLGLSGPSLADDFRDAAAVRQTSIHLQSERLPLTNVPVTEPVRGDTVPVALAATGLEPGRRVIVKGRGLRGGREFVHLATLTGVEAAANGSILTIAPRLPDALRRDTVVVHANVALASHGETVSQILGAGDGSQRFQRFDLKRLPLTYRSATNESGANSELTVRVGDVEWTEHPTLFGRGPTDRVYMLQSDEQGETLVVFGDGLRGTRLPTGVNNVRATYRQGLGRDGNVAADTLTQLVTQPLGLKGVSNPAAAQGGTDPEPAREARRTMPLAARTLGRVVSLLDYEDFALAFAGIAKAQATVLQLPAGPTVVITLAAQGGNELPPANRVRQNLTRALKESGDPHVSIMLLSYQASTFRLGLKVKGDPAYQIEPLLAAVETALRARYSFEARSLGEPVFQSDVVAVVHSVPGVLALDVDFLYGGTSPTSQTVKSRQSRLLASRMRAVNGLARPAELLTLDPGPLDRLEEMP